MTELMKARLAAEAASVERAVASRNDQIRRAVATGLSVREVEAVTGIPKSTVQRLGAAAPLSEADYLELANAEVVARAEVVALEAVAETLASSDSTSDTEA